MRHEMTLPPTTLNTQERGISTAVTDEATLGSVWRAAGRSEMDDELLGWRPDVFLLTNILLERSEAHRFALSPANGVSWPPAHIPDWATVVAAAGRGRSTWVDDPERGIPDVVAEEWAIVRDSAQTPIEQLVEAGDWRLCEALLTLHATAGRWRLWRVARGDARGPQRGPPRPGFRVAAPSSRRVPVAEACDVLAGCGT
jgi:hypothetical protein